MQNRRMLNPISKSFLTCFVWYPPKVALLPTSLNQKEEINEAKICPISNPAPIKPEQANPAPMNFAAAWILVK